jgi:hypothetical protein
MPGAASRRATSTTDAPRVSRSRRRSGLLLQPVMTSPVHRPRVLRRLFPDEGQSSAYASMKFHAEAGHRQAYP